MAAFDIQGGTQPPKSTFKHEPTKGYVRLLQIRDFGEKPVPTFIQSKPTLKTCQKNDILIGRYGASIGRICTGMEGAYNVALAKVIIPEQIDRRFVFHILRSPFFQRPILDIERSAQDGFNKQDLAEIILPLAPLAEQRRIVAKLEKLLVQVDACLQRLEKMPTLLKRFRQSVLAAACSGRLTADWREENAADETASAEDLPDGWENAPFSKFIESSFYGPRFGKEDYASEGVPTIRTTDIAFDGTIVLTAAPRIKLSADQIEKYRLLHGDLVVTRTGATIGKCAIYDESRGPAIPSAYLIRFRFKQDLVDSKYILRFFMSPAGQSLLVAGSNAVAQPNVNATTISQFIIPIPPLAEQQEIVRRVEGLFALADQLEQRLAQARKLVEKLTPSLLARAFAGKLMPQDANDEPASALLERIQMEREQPKEKVLKGKPAQPPTSQPQFDLGIPPLSAANIFEQRAALNAYVLSQRLHDKKFGRTIMEKSDELFEYHCGLPLRRERMRDAAGPVDYPSRLKVEENAKELNWFSTVEHKLPGGKTFIEYVPGKNFSEAMAIAGKFMGDKKPAVDRIIKLMKPLSTDDCSIIGTLYAAWNDLLIFQKPISDDLVINESRNNWHPAKKNIPLSDWRRGLDWLRKHNVIPKGHGKPTLRKT